MKVAIKALCADCNFDFKCVVQIFGESREAFLLESTQENLKKALHDAYPRCLTCGGTDVFILAQDFPENEGS